LIRNLAIVFSAYKPPPPKVDAAETKNKLLSLFPGGRF